MKTHHPNPRFNPISALVPPALLLLALLAGCGGEETAKTDPVGSDATAQDAGATTDAGASGDTGAATKDAGSGSDAGGKVDAGPVDAGGKPPVFDDDIDSAQDKAIGDVIEAKLEKTGDVDYYKFAGKKGDLLHISVKAQVTPFEKEAIDTVLTLYGPDKLQMAINDDPDPRLTNDSVIFTRLPKDGTYYLRMEECWTYIENAPGSCAEPKDKTKVDYTLTIAKLTGDDATMTVDAEKGSDAASANVVSYGPLVEGNFVPVHLFGMFSDKKDVDVFSFKLPADTPKQHKDGPTMAYFGQFPKGKTGYGSTTDIGEAWVVAADAPEVLLAKTDFTTGGRIWMPLDWTKSYLLFVAHPGFNEGANDFYLLKHSAFTVPTKEQDDAANNTSKGAQVLTAVKDEDQTTTQQTHTVLGHLGKDDVDWYEMPIPDGQAADVTVAGVCVASRNGSGLKGLRVLTHTVDDKEILEGFAEESTWKPASFLNLKIPEGAKALRFKVSADSMHAGVSGDYYACDFALVTPKKTSTP